MRGEKMTFRFANVEDCSILDTMLTKLIMDERKYDKSIDKNFKVQNFYQNVLGKNNIIYLCEEENKIIGYVYTIINSENAVIDALYVEECYRNKKIATTLITEIIKVINEKNIYKILINVMSDNIVAKNFYLSLGFKPFRETLILNN